MLSVQGLVKAFASRDGAPRPAGVPANAVDGVSFTVDKDDFFTLLGPSGCGKTTTLQCIAGLETPTEGRIEIGGKAVVLRARAAAGAFQPARPRDDLPVVCDLAAYERVRQRGVPAGVRRARDAFGRRAPARAGGARPREASRVNVLSGEIIQLQFLGDSVEVDMGVAGHIVRAMLDPYRPLALGRP